MFSVHHCRPSHIFLGVFLSFPFWTGPVLLLTFFLIVLLFQIACSIFIQGSGWVDGSPAALSSASSTPSRGRRQLPQTPLTPRPGVAYRTASSSPVHIVPAQASLSRMSRGQSEHNALRQSGSRHFPCPVTRISSEPYLGLGRAEPLDSPCGSLREQLDVFRDAASLSPSPSVGSSSRTTMARAIEDSHPPLPVNFSVPNGYHVIFGDSGSTGSGIKALRPRR